MMANDGPTILEQAEFTDVFCARPQNFAWFLGAGTSRTAGLPTANDIIWDLKVRYYCREENQDISHQDVQNEAIAARIQVFMESRNFPGQWSENEYADYFQRIFGDNKERQRQYLRAILSEDKIRLSIGNRVLAAFMASKLCRIVFTTNFDTVVEKALAEVAGQALTAFHLEGSTATVNALNNEEFPIYCKLHGDFRYESLKNLPADLATQNDALAQCLTNAANRFGMVVAGYSGRDHSIMSLFRSVLKSPNPFPHGLFWTSIKGSPIHPGVSDLLSQAREAGVQACRVPIETFDALLLRLWRNTPNKTPGLDANVRKSRLSFVQIPLPLPGNAKPLVRLNAVPVLARPTQCLKLTFDAPKEWKDLRQAQKKQDRKIICTKGKAILAWGTEADVKHAFGNDLIKIEAYDLSIDFTAPESLYVQRFCEEALCLALSRGKPLRHTARRSDTFLHVDSRATDKTELEPLRKVVSNTSGTIAGLEAPVTEEHPVPVAVKWAEAVRVSLDVKHGQCWLLLIPDIWIWPIAARQSAVDFMDQRRGDRFNKKYNELLDAWIQVLFGTSAHNIEMTLSAFSAGTPQENPTFQLGNRTAFTRRS